MNVETDNRTAKLGGSPILCLLPASLCPQLCIVRPPSDEQQTRLTNSLVLHCRCRCLLLDLYVLHQLSLHNAEQCM